MVKRSTKYYLLQGIIVAIIALMCLLGYAITNSLKVAEAKLDENLQYVSYEILTDNAMPVSKEDEEETVTVSSEIVRPYDDTSVKIGKSYYDYKGEEEKQQDSIIYYENTYIQNTGVDYVSKEVFQVMTIADGTVISVTEDDITGKTIKIKHDNEMISVYQSVNDISVKEEDTVKKGQVIATSGTNNINSDLGNHLHFELYNKNILVNPEEFFTNNQGN